MQCEMLDILKGQISGQLHYFYPFNNYINLNIILILHKNAFNNCYIIIILKIINIFKYCLKSSQKCIVIIGLNFNGRGDQPFSPVTDHYIDQNISHIIHCTRASLSGICQDPKLWTKKVFFNANTETIQFQVEAIIHNEAYEIPSLQ